MYGGSSDGEGHEGPVQRKIPPASSMLWVRNLRRFIGSGAGLGSEALMGLYFFSPFVSPFPSFLSHLIPFVAYLLLACELVIPTF